MLNVPYVAWEIEEKCNMGCLFCYSSSWNMLFRHGERVKRPSIANIEAGLKKLRAIGVEYINWTGGEPLLREKQSRTIQGVEGLKDIFKLANDYGIKNILSTNGWFSDIFPDSDQVRSRQEFWKFLSSIDPYLFFLSLSWDSADPGVTNGIMRIKKSFNIARDELDVPATRLPDDMGRHASDNHQDIREILNKIREDIYHFNLKINTLVTKANKDDVKDMLPELRDIPCIWKLTQYNPRESPKKYRKCFEIDNSEFFKIYHEITLERELMKPAAKCVMASRLYDGQYDPYCFFVVNANGDLLLPLADSHIPLLRIYSDEQAGEPSEDRFREELEEKLYAILSQLPHTAREAGQSDTRSKYFGTINPQDKAAHLIQFSKMNRKIVESAYNNSRFLDVQADLSINKLAKASREYLANLQETTNRALLDDTARYEDQINELEGMFSCFPARSDSPTPAGDIRVRTSSKLKHLYEQNTVGRIVESSLGIIGGSFVILSKNSREYRITPFLQRAPYGLQFPWVFADHEKKRDFYRSFFSHISDVPADKENIFELALLKNTLPSETIRRILDDLKINKSLHEATWHKIKDYLSEREYSDEEWRDITNSIIVPIILNACIERTAGQLQRVWDERNSPTEETPLSGAEKDPLFNIFFDLQARKDFLSPVERELNALIIPAEEAVFVVSKWLYGNTARLPGGPRLFNSIRTKWLEMANSQRVAAWKFHQRDGERKFSLSCKMYRSALVNDDYSNIFKRIAPIYWLYLLNPNRKYSAAHKCELIPHTWFNPYVDDTENGLRAFAGFYFDDDQLSSFWQEGIWEAISRPSIMGYSFRANSLISPIAFYNSHLEMQETVRRVFRKEATKSAISSVMMRNMSHNIGSHVLARLTSKENLLEARNKVEGSTDDRIIQKYTLNVINDLLDKYRMRLKQDTKKYAIQDLPEILDFARLASCALSDMGTLNSYLKTRMDFLADVATSEPLIVINKWLCQDILQHFKPIIGRLTLESAKYPSFLINNISGGSLGEDKIEIVFEGGDVRVAIPNDHLGAHALYIILENIIRNCVKHSGESIAAQGKLALTLSVDSCAADNMIRVTIADNIVHKKADLEVIDNYIYQSVLDERARLRLGGWGLLEMELATAYLRRVPLSVVDENPINDAIEYEKDGISHKGPFLLKGEIQQPGDNLAFSFFMEKPRELAIVWPRLNLSPDEESVITKHGIHIINSDSIRPEELSNKVRDFPLVIIPNGVDDSITNRLRFENVTYLSHDGSYLGLLGNPQELLSKVWGKFVEERWTVECYENKDYRYWKVSSDNSDEGNNRKYIYDHHGENPHLSSYYYEPYSSQSGTNSYLSSIKRCETNNILYYHQLLFELMRSADVRCAIIDERIQCEAEKQRLQSKEVYNSTIFERMKIFVPNMANDSYKMDLSDISFGGPESTEMLFKWLRNIDPLPSYALIHHTLLEKMAESTDAQEIKEWIDKFSSDFRSTVLITISGRGTPSNLPGNVFFLPYSIVSRYVLEDRSKYHLAKVLFAARRKKL